MREFKYEDKVLKEIYGHSQSTYHFDFLQDSIIILNNLVTITVGLANAELERYLLRLAEFLDF